MSEAPPILFPSLIQVLESCVTPVRLGIVIELSKYLPGVRWMLIVVKMAILLH